MFLLVRLRSSVPHSGGAALAVPAYAELSAWFVSRVILALKLSGKFTYTLEHGEESTCSSPRPARWQGSPQEVDPGTAPSNCAEGRFGIGPCSQEKARGGGLGSTVAAHRSRSKLDNV